jgi:hypothetical protein
VAGTDEAAERKKAYLSASSPTAVAAAAVVVALVLKTVADPDLWGHLAFGRHILAHGIPATDPFSYTAGEAPWIDHEWLSEVAMYAAFRIAGSGGLLALKAAALASMFGLVLFAMRDAGASIRAMAVTAVVIAIGGMASFVTIRPHMFTFPLVAAFLLAIVRADRGSPGLLWLTPALTVLGSNFHGGIAAALAVLFLWGGTRLVEAAAEHRGILPKSLQLGTHERTPALIIAVVLGLQLPAALMTPYGIHFWRFVGQTVSSGLPEISEWQHPMIDDLQDVLALVALGLLVALAAVSRGVRRDPLHLLLVGLLIGAGLTARRHLTLALIGVAVLEAPAIANTLRPSEGSRPSNRMRPMDAVVVFMAATILVVGVQRGSCIRIDPATTPRGPVTYLSDAAVSGNMVVLFDWGMYAIWNLAPRVRVSMDGRATSVYSPAELRAHVAFLAAGPAWQAGLRDADLALLSPRFAVYQKLAADPGWRLAIEDRTSGLFVRRGSPSDERLASTRPPTIDPNEIECFSRSSERCQPGACESSKVATTARWSDG